MNCLIIYWIYPHIDKGLEPYSYNQANLLRNMSHWNSCILNFSFMFLFVIGGYTSAKRDYLRLALALQTLHHFTYLMLGYITPQTSQLADYGYSRINIVTTFKSKSDITSDIWSITYDQCRFKNFGRRYRLSQCFENIHKKCALVKNLRYVIIC